MNGNPPDFEPVARCDEIAAGTYQLFSCGSVELLVLNIGGVFHAVQNLCSHMAKPLAGGRLLGTRIVCPYHSGAFDVRTGAHVCFPATRPIRTYATRVKNGMVEVNVHDMVNNGQPREQSPISCRT